MEFIRPFSLHQWIDKHRSRLKPPVNNEIIFKDTEFIIMAVGGPNSRSDYHVDPAEEFFYQLEGDIFLRLWIDGSPKDVPIRQGEIFLLPPRIPHSPQRPAGTVGLVIERQRREGELDGFQWYCDHCHHKLYEEFFPLKDIVHQLPPLFQRFYQNEKLTTCQQCGTRHVQN